MLVWSISAVDVHRFQPPWLASVSVRVQLVFVAPRVRLWLILAFQLQLYTKTSSIGQQVILDSEAPARHFHWPLVRGTYSSLGTIIMGSFRVVLHPGTNSSSLGRERNSFVRFIILVSMLLYFSSFFFLLFFFFLEALRIHRRRRML